MNNNGTATLAAIEQWHDTLARYDTAIAACRSGQSISDTEIEAHARKASDLFTELLETPSPTREALRWKISQLLETGADDPFTQSWNGLVVAQTLRDLDRYLPEGRG